LFSQDGSDGRADFAGGEGAGCYLIEERLEEVEITAVDQG
jgi:hypothetical protein